MKIYTQKNYLYSFCENQRGQSIEELKEEYIKDSLYVTYNEPDGEIDFKIVNTTQDTLYLFLNILQINLQIE